MATVYASGADGTVWRSYRTTWADARGSSSGTYYNNGSVRNPTTVASDKLPSRGGGYLYSVHR